MCVQMYMGQDLVMETINMHFTFQSCVLRNTGSQNTGIIIYFFTGKINMDKKVCKPHILELLFFFLLFELFFVSWRRIIIINAKIKWTQFCQWIYKMYTLAGETISLLHFLYNTISPFQFSRLYRKKIYYEC